MPTAETPWCNEWIRKSWEPRSRWHTRHRPVTPVFFCLTLPASPQLARVQLTDGLQAPEYHRLYHFAVTSDMNGYYRLPPARSRVAQLMLHAAHGGLTPVESAFCPDYTQRENRFDFIFR